MPFLRISRLDVHKEKTHFIGSSLEQALPELKTQACLSVADAVIEIKEHSSTLGETKIVLCYCYRNYIYTELRGKGVSRK